ncbi:MAG: peptide deformylase [Alphaproteobacteria bacterium]|jgi:peptide deformylase
MTIHTILTEPDPILRQISKPVDTVTDAHRTLMHDMLETMYDAPGIGLAAIQIGEPLRIIVMDISDHENGAPKEPQYFINPEITQKSDDLEPYKEGCLSVPEIYEMVKRPTKVTVSYLDYHGTPQILHADGLLSVCIQHEMDHLEGVLFLDRLSKLKRQMVMRKLRKTRNIKLV